MLTALSAGVTANPAALGTLFTALTTATAYGITGTGTGGAVTAAENTSLVAAQTASSGQSLALAAITAVDNALTEVNTASAQQGALQNRFSAVISNLTAFSQSQTAAKSRIVDADFAAETAKLSKNQILQQAGTAMLAQANQLPSGVLSLLK
jgi:flagellin